MPRSALGPAGRQRGVVPDRGAGGRVPVEAHQPGHGGAAGGREVREGEVEQLLPGAQQRRDRGGGCGWRGEEPAEAAPQQEAARVSRAGADQEPLQTRPQGLLHDGPANNINMYQ